MEENQVYINGGNRRLYKLTSCENSSSCFGWLTVAYVTCLLKCRADIALCVPSGRGGVKSSKGEGDFGNNCQPPIIWGSEEVPSVNATLKSVCCYKKRQPEEWQLMLDAISVLFSSIAHWISLISGCELLTNDCFCCIKVTMLNIRLVHLTVFPRLNALAHFN